MLNSMKVYMDACCLNRPFDDQGQDRVRAATVIRPGVRVANPVIWFLEVVQ